jgi:transposase
MFERDQPYHDLGVDYFIRRDDPQRRARELIRQLEAIGYTVHAQPPPAAA